MKKSTIITIVAFVVGVIVLATAFILLTPNNISNGLFHKTTTEGDAGADIDTTTVTTQRVNYQALDYSSINLSDYVTLGAYKGFTIEVDQLEATEEEIDMQIDFILILNNAFNKIEQGTISESDVFSFDFTGYFANEDGSKGLPFSGGAGKNQLAYIEGNTLFTVSTSGIGSFIDGFAQGMINKNIGDTLEIPITFPDNYSADMAGKKTIFEVKINYIADPAFTDEWVNKSTEGELKTCEEYREYIRGAINDIIDESNQALLWNEIISAAKVTIPEQQFNYLYYTEYRYMFEDYATMFGMTYDQFLQSGYAAYFTGVEIYSDSALISYVNQSITNELILRAIIEAEGIEVTDEIYNAFMETLMEKTGKTEAELLTEYGGKDIIVEEILLDRVNKMILEENKFVIKE